jgi:hypothetical protein
MEYTTTQIEKAKKNYNAFMRLHTLSDYEVEIIGINAAEQRLEYHNKIVTAIRNGDKELEREWKLFFLEEAVKADQKRAERKEKLTANKAASASILEPIKKMRKMGEFGKWLNTPGNQFRKQHFNKKYTEEAVNAFLQTL